MVTTILVSKHHSIGMHAQINYLNLLLNVRNVDVFHSKTYSKVIKVRKEDKG
jgi:hypothetical protein